MTDLVDIGFRARTEELQRATRELDKFERATEEASAATDKLGRESDETSKAVNRTTQTTSQATARTRGLAEAKTQAANAAQNYASRLGPIGGILSSIGPAGLAAAAAIGGISVAMSRAIGVANEFDKINAALRIASGSAELAQKEFEFLAENASKLGVDLQSSALQFARFSAAAKGTALEGEAAREIFIGISQASVALGLSSEEASRAFVAIQQSASKGKVSAEELRQQLGEAIPRAVPLLAEAMGISVAALDKLLERGEVGVEKLALLGIALQDFYGPEAQNMANQYQGSVARLGNELDLLFDVFGQKAQDALSPLYNAGAEAVKKLRLEIQQADSAGTLPSLREIAAFLINPGQAIGMAVGKSLAQETEELVELTSALDYDVLTRDLEKYTQETQDAANSVEALYEWIEELDSSSQRASDSAIEYAVALQEQRDAAVGTTRETQNLEFQLQALESGGVAALEAVIDAQKISNRIASEAPGLVDQYGVSLSKAQSMVAEQIAVERQLEAARGAVNDKTEEQVTLIGLMKGAAEEAGRAIQRSLSDSFRDVLDGNIRSFRDFFSSVVDIAKNAAAQIASQFVMSNITSFLRGGGGVGLGSFLSTGAAAAGGGGGGAMQAAGNLGSIAGGLGALWQNATLGGGFGGLTSALGAFGPGGGGLAQVLGLGQMQGTLGFAPSALGTAANFAGVAALGAGGGMLLADLLGNQSATGGAIGGGAGAALGFAVGGPLGALVGGALGGSLGGLIGGKQDKGSFALQTGGSGFTGGISQQSAFGNIGLGRGTSDIGGDLAGTLLGAVAQADQLVASALTESQIRDVRNALQGTGQIVRTGRGNKYFEQAFGKAIADRFLRIFQALGIAAPSGLSGLARNDGTAGSATAGDVLGLALPALSQGLGLDNQASSSIVDQLSGASGPSADLLGNIGTELVVGNQIQESNGQTLRQIRNAIDELTSEVRRGSGALA